MRWSEFRSRPAGCGWADWLLPYVLKDIDKETLRKKWMTSDDCWRPARWQLTPGESRRAPKDSTSALLDRIEKEMPPLPKCDGR